MKTWEVIKELTENPNKKFTSTIDSSRPDEKRTIICEGTVIRIINDNHLHISDEWKEVKEAVDFMDAVKALDEGKTIYVLHDGDYKDIFSPVGNQTDWGVAMKQEQGYAIDTEFILYGKWYIED